MITVYIYSVRNAVKQNRPERAKVKAFKRLHRLQILQWALRIAFIPVVVFAMYLNITHRLTFPWNYAITFCYLVVVFALWIYVQRTRAQVYHNNNNLQTK